MPSTEWELRPNVRILGIACRPDAPLFYSGALLALCGTFHLSIWAVSGTAWAGDVSWRKPALFGLSGGLTLISMGFLLPLLERRRRDVWLSQLLSIGMVTEVGLITLQQWRGVASHFNRATPFDSVVDLAITGLILLVTLLIVDLTLSTFLRLNAPADVKVAWRGGMVFLLASCVIGFAILAYGISRTAIGEDPTVYGAAGVVKFPHGMTIHAVQLLPAVCWFMTRASVPSHQRARTLRYLCVSIALLLGYSIVQTLDGRDRGDATIYSAALLLLAALFAVPMLAITTRRLLLHARRCMDTASVGDWIKNS